MAQAEFVIAKNPELDSSLPYLIRLPLGEAGVVLKARDTWPRTAKVYCHRAEGWPADSEIVERVPVRSCVRRGAAVDLILERGRENRSQIVFTRIRGGREAIFWQSARTARQARPNVGVRVLVVRADGSPSSSTSTSAIRGASPASRRTPLGGPSPRATTRWSSTAP